MSDVFIPTEDIIARKVLEISDALGIEQTVSNKDTPYRIARMLNRELFKNRFHTPQECKPLDEVMYTEPAIDNSMVIVRGIPFSSSCEHHWLPFSGTVDVGYVPEALIIGLSKIPRVVEFFSRKPQLQEKYVREIGEYLCRILEPRCLFVRATAKHGCVSCRGIERDCETVTSFRHRGEHCTDTMFFEYRREFQEARLC